MGDLHPFGNPHYLLDPLNGLKVAALIRARFSNLQPANAQYFAQRYEAFRQRLGAAMVGETLASKYEFDKLAILFERGKLIDFLKAQGEDKQLAGWLGLMRPYFGLISRGGLAWRWWITLNRSRVFLRRQRI
jgi:hypothetical protein